MNRQQMSLAYMGKGNPMYGRVGKLSPRFGKKHSEEMKKKLSELNKDKYSGKNNGMYGKVVSFETRQKMSLSQSERLRNKKNHPMFGKKRSELSKLKMSNKIKYLWKDPNSIYNQQSFRKNLSKALTGKFIGKVLSEKTKQKIKVARSKQILPLKDTKIEVKIQNFLKELKIDFFTHQYINIEHGYQCDILIPSKNLIIECDGEYWHQYPIGRPIDQIRTNELLETGFKVLRLWGFEIKAMNINQFENKLEAIK